MHELVFATYGDVQRLSVFGLAELNRALFSCVPHPDYGGRLRRANAMVMGARFDTVDHQQVYPALLELEHEVGVLEDGWRHMTRSSIVARIARMHHRIAVIHPFAGGSGRTSRAFANLMLLRYGLVPLYVGVNERKEYQRVGCGR